MKSSLQAYHPLGRSTHPSANSHGAVKMQHYSHNAAVGAAQSGTPMAEREPVGNRMYLSQLEKER